MIGSPNYVRKIYDGDGSAFGLEGPEGSGEIEALFADFYADRGLAFEETEISFRSDYAAFFDTDNDLVRHAGIQPEVIEYLKQPPSKAKLAEFARATGLGVRGLLREKGTPYAELGLGDPKWTDDELLDLCSSTPF